MSIRLGVYDFFSYMLSGVLFLAGAFLAIQLWIGAPVGENWKSLTVQNLLQFGGASYIVGHIAAPLAGWNPWYWLLGPERADKAALDEIHKTYPRVEFHFEAAQWLPLQAAIALKNQAITDLPEQLRAPHIMLGSTSLALLILSVFTVAYLVEAQNPTAIVWCVGFLLISGLSVRANHVFAKWSSKIVFELTLAMNGCVNNAAKPISTECRGW